MEVRIQDLEVRRDGRFRLHVADLRFPEGSVTALFGPNGAGKTTLLRSIAGLERISFGSVLLDGAAASRVAPSRVAYAFQEPVFFSGTVRHNLALALDLGGVRGVEARRRIAEATAATGTSALLDVDARRLSGGEAQRVNLARTLALRSSLTLLDEPLGHLDGPIRLRLLDDLPDLLQRFTRTTIVVSHDREEVFRLADRLVVLVDGTVCAQGDKTSLLRHPPTPRVAELLGFLLVRCGGDLLAIHPRRLRLGDGPLAIEMRVRRVVDLGHGREVSGVIGDTRVAIALPGDRPAPRPGDALAVIADDVVRFPADS